MLTEISIRNYALIESLKIDFDEGLNVLTGETGAGKSIIVDAMGLLLGERASPSVVRKDSQRCEIAAVINIKKNKAVHSFLQTSSLHNPDDGQALFLRREIDTEGKSRNYINDKPVNLSTLSALGDLLVDVHGQHDHQCLLQSGRQRDLLDSYGGNESVREELKKKYQEWKNCAEQLKTSELSEQEKNQKIDLYRFHLQEIESANLAVGEEEEIEKILPQLKNSERLRELTGELHSQLYESEGSAMDRLRKSQKILSSILNLGVDLKQSPLLLEESVLRVGEVVNELESIRNNLVTDPGTIDEVIGRQDTIFKLKKKYGKTIEEVLQYKEKIKEDLSRLEGHSEAVQELEKRMELSHSQLLRLCKKLTLSRNKFSEKLSASVEKELKEMGFARARFEVQFFVDKDEKGKETPTPAGFEKVEFAFSANPGEDLKPLKEVASGGELSRVMLALKKICAQSDTIPTLIFDEIDSGIGGSMGLVIGEKLKKLSRSHQILVITHLPQIAANADRHFSVRKNISGQRTQTFVASLEKEERVKEIARMLGGTSFDGAQPTSSSIKHASELLLNARSN